MDGSKGPAGEMGEVGEVGPVGKEGISGAKGEPGLAGPKGPPGPPGTRGRNGNPGQPGKPGYKSGYKGKDGSMGPYGPKGPPGQQGIPGEPGPRGPTGYPGEGDGYSSTPEKPTFNKPKKPSFGGRPPKQKGTSFINLLSGLFGNKVSTGHSGEVMDDRNHKKRRRPPLPPQRQPHPNQPPAVLPTPIPTSKDLLTPQIRPNPAVVIDKPAPPLPPLPPPPNVQTKAKVKTRQYFPVKKGIPRPPRRLKMRKPFRRLRKKKPPRPRTPRRPLGKRPQKSRERSERRISTPSLLEAGRRVMRDRG